MMRLLKLVVVGVGVLIVLALGVLFCLGLRPGAGRTHAAIDVAAPPDSVFAWVTTPAYQKRWVSGLTEVRQDTATAGIVGSRDTWIMEDPGSKQSMSMASEVTRWEPPHRVDVRVWSAGPFDGTYAYTVTPTTTGTHLELNGISHYGPLSARLLEPLITPQANKQMRDDLARLKAGVEAGAK